MEIVCIPTSILDNELEKTFCKIVDQVVVKINDRDIESCHRGGSQDRTIVKFSHMKDCQQLMKVKNYLSKLNLIDLGNTKIFIKVGLPPSKKNLFYLLHWESFKNDEKCFLFHLKSSFRSQDI